jgi:hypothetical protein
MGVVWVGTDLEALDRRFATGAKRGAAAKKWMEIQTTNVLAEARDRSTPVARLDELARNGTAPVLQAVAGNPSASPAALHYLTSYGVLTSAIAKRLVVNPSTPFQALVNVAKSEYATWWGNAERARLHPNWLANQNP